jgi:hypothetical protein
MSPKHSNKPLIRNILALNLLTRTYFPISIQQIHNWMNFPKMKLPCPCCYKCHGFLFKGIQIHKYMYVYIYIYIYIYIHIYNFSPYIYWRALFFYTLAVMNNDVMNMRVQIFCWHSDFILFGDIFKMGFLDHMEIQSQVFEETPYCFPKICITVFRTLLC